ncbi:hypothetical protein [Amycolatopsis sp. GM8]|uniref:hypothetical protein n=1 Tax=Amycolatopsis sp. GM8 TaxID=2896530 RepID=UPI001F1A6157|nr:hypothetical protein [Amycolatopsis sp. GM8]
MSKIMIRLAGLVAVFTLLFGGFAQAAENGTPGAAAPRTAHPESAAEQPPSETRAIVVGGLAFVLMIGAAGAVVWYTARGRHSMK